MPSPPPAGAVVTASYPTFVTVGAIKQANGWAAVVDNPGPNDITVKIRLTCAPAS
jgi:hypothetical protein